MSANAVLVTHPQLSDEAKSIFAERQMRAVYLEPPISEDMLIETITREGVAGVLMRLSPPFTRRVLEAVPALEIIVKHGAGIDSVDLQAATERGIAVCITGGANADAVAEQAIATMLSLARELPRLDRSVRKGFWLKGSYQGREFRGRRVGIVGYGQVGRRVALMAAALGAKVLAYSRSRREGGDVQWESDLDRLLGAIDILSLHCPLSAETRGLIGERELGLLKPGAILINTARGELVDEQALLAALRSGRLAAAALDTFAHEPLPRDHPFMTMENVLLTPHIAAMTEEAMTRMGTMAATQIVEYLDDGVLDRGNLVNAAVAPKLERG